MQKGTRSIEEGAGCRRVWGSSRRVRGSGGCEVQVGVGCWKVRGASGCRVLEGGGCRRV
jgi:hypothetical protein